jgi:hypothetical protein
MDSLFAYRSLPKTLRETGTDLNIQSWTLLRSTFASHTQVLPEIVRSGSLISNSTSLNIRKISNIKLHLNPLKYERAMYRMI